MHASVHARLYVSVTFPVSIDGFFPRILSLVRLETKMNQLGFGVKRSRVLSNFCVLCACVILCVCVLYGAARCRGCIS